MIIYKKGSLFEAEGLNNVLVHACNCRGSWGAGIASQFKNRYFNAYKDYKKLCMVHGNMMIGMGILFSHKDLQKIGYLFTSKNFGKEVDSTEEIITATELAISCMLKHLPKGLEIHSPKINSGLFGVPWQETEKVINKCLEEYNIKWTVWEL